MNVMEKVDIPRSEARPLKREKNTLSPAATFIERLTQKNYEIDYSTWWEKRPLSDAKTTVRFKTSQGAQEFELPISERSKNEFGCLNLPDSFHIPPGLKLENLLYIANSLKDLKIDPEVLEYQQKKLINIAFSRLSAKIQSGAINDFHKHTDANTENRVNITEFSNFKKIIEKYQQTKRGGLSGDPYFFEINLLELLFPQFQNDSPIDFAEKLLSYIKEIEKKYGLEGNDSLIEEDINYQYQDWMQNRSFFLPFPAIYHDDWNNPLFYEKIKAGIVVGDFLYVGKNEMHDYYDNIDDYDRDVPAYLAMMREAENMIQVKHRKKTEKLTTPPNMTNVFYLKMPAITPEISEHLRREGKSLIEKEIPFNQPGKPNERATFKSDNSNDGRVTVFFLDSYERINPDVFSEWANNYCGEGSWVAVTSKNSNDGKLETLVPAPEQKRIKRMVYLPRGELDIPKSKMQSYLDGKN